MCDIFSDPYRIIVYHCKIFLIRVQRYSYTKTELSTCKKKRKSHQLKNDMLSALPTSVDPSADATNCFTSPDVYRRQHHTMRVTSSSSRQQQQQQYPSATSTIKRPVISIRSVDDDTAPADNQRQHQSAAVVVGYDIDLVDELTEADRARYVCPICLLLLRDPMQTSCGHRFCLLCIKRWCR